MGGDLRYSSTNLHLGNTGECSVSNLGCSMPRKEFQDKLDGRPGWAPEPSWCWGREQFLTPASNPVAYHYTELTCGINLSKCPICLHAILTIWGEADKIKASCNDKNKHLTWATPMVTVYRGRGHVLQAAPLSRSQSHHLGMQLLHWCLFRTTNKKTTPQISFLNYNILCSFHEESSGT
jgi:hypothetical protein